MLHSARGKDVFCNPCFSASYINEGPYQDWLLRQGYATSYQYGLGASDLRYVMTEAGQAHFGPSRYFMRGLYPQLGLFKKELLAITGISAAQGGAMRVEYTMKITPLIDGVQDLKIGVDAFCNCKKPTLDGHGCTVHEEAGKLAFLACASAAYLQKYDDGWRALAFDEIPPGGLSRSEIDR
jgi:hypothetical protein